MIGDFIFMTIMKGYYFITVGEKIVTGTASKDTIHMVGFWSTIAIPYFIVLFMIMILQLLWAVSIPINRHGLDIDVILDNHEDGHKRRDDFIRNIKKQPDNRRFKIALEMALATISKSRVDLIEYNRLNKTDIKMPEIPYVLEK